MKLVFMGTPGFAVPALEALHQAGHQIVGVYTQAPKPAGRGMKLQPSPVQRSAEALGLTVRTPSKLNDDEVTWLKAQAPDLICVAAYGLLLPGKVLAVAPCVNVHPSRLPRWRGAAPLNHTLLAGDSDTDLCIMAMEKGLDTGPVYKRVAYPVGGEMTFGELHDLMAQEGAKHLVSVVNDWPRYRDVAVPQSAEGMTYAPKILPEHRRLDFTRTAAEVHNHIRGLSPFPTACFTLLGEDFKVQRSQVVAGQGSAGTVLQASPEAGLVIACGQGAVRLLELQRAGKRPMTDADLLRGLTIPLGTLVG